MNVSRGLSYFGALAVGVVFVVTVFPADLLLGGVVPDDRLLDDVAEHVVGHRAFPDGRLALAAVADDDARLAAWPQHRHDPQQPAGVAAA